MCTEEIHQMLIHEEDAINCIFCNKQIQDPGKPKRYFCCSNMKLVKDGYLVCKNCGQVHDYLLEQTSLWIFMEIDKGKEISMYTTENIIV